MSDIFQKIENNRAWIFMKNNYAVLVLIGGFFAFIVVYFVLPNFNKKNPETVISGKPNVKIISVAYEGKVYQESPTTKSEAINFRIPIRNEGDGEAFDVQIKQKILKLPRGTFTKTTPSLQTPFTITPFDLPERKIALDSIFIDDNPENMRQVKNGEKSIAIEYEIIYYADKNKKRGYIYTYKNSTTDGVFKEETAEESIREKP